MKIISRAVLGAVCIAALAFSAGSALAQNKAPAKKNSAWVKLCDVATIKKNEKDKGIQKKICLTHHERLDGNTGLVLVSAAIRTVEGKKPDQFLVQVPLGMVIQPGVQVQIDKEKPIRLKYTLCHPGGCTAEIPLADDFLKQMDKGQKMVVAAINVGGKLVGFPVPLNGFNTAYKGKPVDPKVYQAARRKLMLRIRERQQQLAKKAAEERKKKADAAKKQ